MAAWMAIAPRRDQQVVIHSENMGEEREFLLGSAAGDKHDWSNYSRGVIALLQQRGMPLRGANIWLSSEVPIGSGLSSSAAIETVTALAFLGISGANLDGRETALLCQRAEHEYVGTRCGIMDQFISRLAVDGRALLLDCRSLEFRTVPIPSEVAIVICNSMVKHSLASGEYNVRRAQCEEAVAVLRRLNPAIRALRDVALPELLAQQNQMAPVIFRRARHVVTEIERTLAFASALENQQLTAAGELMYASHASLRDDYEVSCRELDELVNIAHEMPSTIGARMTGGGFGGCTVNLVRAEQAEAFAAAVKAEYQARMGIQADLYVTRARQRVRAE